MRNKLMTGAVVAGAMALGSVGMASAATTAPPSGSTGTVTIQVPCAKVPAWVAKIQKFEQHEPAKLTALKARLVTAQKAGNTKAVDRLQHRIARVERRDSLAPTVVQKLEAACPSTGGSSTSS